MSIAISFDWSENRDENGESIFNLECPNTRHHEKYGLGWETEYEATKDLEGNKCKPYQGCPTCEDDSGYLAPMMNFIYPLDYDGMVNDDGADSEENRKRRIEIAEKTNCVCVENQKTGEWFLALTGGGMDLSFSIAHAYMIAQKWLPIELLSELNAGWAKCNMSNKDFKKLRVICRQQIKMEISKFRELEKKWNLPIEKIEQ